MSQGEGPIYDTLTKIVEDDFLSGGDYLDQGCGERQRVKSLLATSHMNVGYGAQPPSSPRS
jgi:hypothetical protein